MADFIYDVQAVYPRANAKRLRLSPSQHGTFHRIFRETWQDIGNSASQSQVRIRPGASLRYRVCRICGSMASKQPDKGIIMEHPARPDHLLHAHYVGPSSIKLKFADKRFTLDVSLLGMPVDRFRWETVAASPIGESMTVQGIKGEKIPIDSSTLRYLVDPVYAAEMEASLQRLQLSREELQEIAGDNPPPPELLDQSEQDLTSESWK